MAGNKDAIEILEELDENLSEDSFEEAVANALVLLLRKQYPEIIKLQSSGISHVAL